MSLFKKLSLTSLGLSIFVILWGAWVRFSNSGDGCGNKWPLCDDKLLPSHLPSFIEWFHRLSSGVFLICVLFLFLYSLKLFPKNHNVRKWTTASLIFTLVEAGIGALIVLAGLTGNNSEMFRVVILGGHLINSMLLLASLILVILSQNSEQIEFQKNKIYLLGAFLLVALLGSLASLSVTLFPSSTLYEALLQDISPESHFILKIRWLHPGLASLFLILSSCILTFKQVVKFVLPVWIFGFLTLLLLSPIAMKLGHLFLAILLWIYLVKQAVKR